MGECGRADGVAQGSGCVKVCVCMGRVASVASVARQWGSGWFCKMEEDGMGT